MCGIAGLINPRSIPTNFLNPLHQRSIGDLSDGMLGLLEHRGPDEMGKLLVPQGFLGSARLSIVDLNNGIQPISNETGDIWIVHNGEIYDIEEHIDFLVKKGHRFTTRTDTEVIVHLYEEYGDALVERINGEFAFCLFDRRNRRNLLVRDPFGVRPLFYKSLGQGAFLFASEIKPVLWACGEMTPSISRRAVLQSLEGWTPVPPETSFEGISQLLPGSIGVIDNEGKLTVRRYVRLPGERSNVSQDELFHLMHRSVERRLKADVPVGVYLSGGLDSSIVAALARQISNHELTSFSVEFENEQFDESVDQCAMRNHIGTAHHAIRVGHCDIRNQFVSAVIAAESIVFRSAFVPMFLLSRLVREKGLKVVLTGEGADELFGGYDIFRELMIMQRWAVEPESKSVPQLFSRLYHYLPEFSDGNLRFLIPFYKQFLDQMKAPFAGHRIRWSNGAASANLLVGGLQDVGMEGAASPIEAALFHAFPELSGLDIEELCRQTEILTLLHGYLLSTQGDRMAAAHSVEVRLPFLDSEMIEFAFRQPVCSFIKDFQEKEILFSTFGQMLPQCVRKKKKTPYLAPDAEVFFENGMGEEWRYYFGSEVQLKTGIFDKEAIKAFVERMEQMYRSGKRLTRRDNTFFFVILSSSILSQEISNNLKPKPINNLLKKVVTLTE